jgi:hypothetical protein
VSFVAQLPAAALHAADNKRPAADERLAQSSRCRIRFLAERLTKKAYRIGTANAMQIEGAYHATKPPWDALIVVDRFRQGPRAHTLDSF